MNTEKRTVAVPLAAVLATGELSTDWRARLAAQQSDSAERRKQALAEQSRESSAPGERIRTWERLHALPLPLEPSHPLLRHIAKSTGLTLKQVQEEQRQRTARTVAGNEPPARRRVFDPYCVLPDPER